MSIRTSVHLGVFVDINDLIKNIDIFSDEWERYMCGIPNEKFTMVYDGMSGEYCYFGIEFKSIDDEDMHSFEKFKINTDDISEKQLQVIEKLNELGLEIGENPKLIMFTHCE